MSVGRSRVARVAGREPQRADQPWPAGMRRADIRGLLVHDAGHRSEVCALGRVSIAPLRQGPRDAPWERLPCASKAATSRSRGRRPDAEDRVTGEVVLSPSRTGGIEDASGRRRGLPVPAAPTAGDEMPSGRSGRSRWISSRSVTLSVRSARRSGTRAVEVGHGGAPRRSRSRPPTWLARLLRLTIVFAGRGSGRWISRGGGVASTGRLGNDPVQARRTPEAGASGVDPWSPASVVRRIRVVVPVQGRLRGGPEAGDGRRTTSEVFVTVLGDDESPGGSRRRRWAGEQHQGSSEHLPDVRAAKMLRVGDLRGPRGPPMGVRGGSGAQRAVRRPQRPSGGVGRTDIRCDRVPRRGTLEGSRRRRTPIRCRRTVGVRASVAAMR